MGTQELKGENTRVNAESKVRIPQMPLILRVRLWDYKQVLFNWKPVHLKKKKKKGKRARDLGTTNINFNAGEGC